MKYPRKKAGVLIALLIMSMQVSGQSNLQVNALSTKDVSIGIANRVSLFFNYGLHFQTPLTSYFDLIIGGSYAQRSKPNCPKCWNGNDRITRIDRSYVYRSTLGLKHYMREGKFFHYFWEVGIGSWHTFLDAEYTNLFGASLAEQTSNSNYFKGYGTLGIEANFSDRWFLAGLLQFENHGGYTQALFTDQLTGESSDSRFYSGISRLQIEFRLGFRFLSQKSRMRFN